LFRKNKVQIANDYGFRASNVAFLSEEQCLREELRGDTRKGGGKNKKRMFADDFRVN
jgi:hypothetical protein